MIHNRSQGSIERLDYDDRGNVRISAHVSHEMARRCGAFSIGAKIVEFEIKDAGSANFYALITKAEITEISLTDRPANPLAMVRSRGRVTPMNAYLGLLGEQTDLEIKAVNVLQRKLKVLQQIFSTPTPPAPRLQLRPPVMMTSTPRRPTQFSALAAALNERTA